MMEDKAILDLYVARDELAIAETDRKYGSYCFSVANQILRSAEDSEETVSETLWKTWNSIPPQYPNFLKLFLAKITRELAIDRFRRRKAEKRAATQYALSLEDLSECIPGGETPDEALDSKVLAQHIGAYLTELKPAVRQAFVDRYFFALSLQEIADKQGVTLSWGKTALHRTRLGLRNYLEKEGYSV